MLKQSINSIMIWIISLVVVVAIGGLVIYVSTSSSNMAKTMEERTFSNVADCVIKSFEDFVLNGSLLAQNQAARATMINALKYGDVNAAAKSFSEFLQNTQDAITVAFIFDTKGQIVAGSNTNGEILTKGDRSDRQYVKEILAGKEIYVSPVVLKSRTTGKLIGIISVPVKDEKGKLLGGIALCPDLDVLFKRHIYPLHFGKGGYAFVLDGTGTTLAHPDKKNIMKDMSNVSFIKYALQHKNGSLDYSYNGIKKFLLFKSIKGTNWLIGMTANHSEMKSGAMRQRNVLIGVGFGMILTVILAISFISRRLVFAPLSRIVSFVGKVSHGNYQAELEGTFKYELVALADDIKAMVTEIKNKIGFSEGTLNAITMPFVVVDKSDIILQINQALIDVLHYTGKPQDYIGTHLGEFVYGDKDRKTITYRAIEEEKSLRNIQGTLPTQDGGEVEVLVDTSPIYDLDGNLLAGFAIFNDLTEIKAQQRKIEVQNEKIAATAQEAFSVADQMAGAAEELSAQVEQSSKGTEIQRERVSETVTSMEEMNTTVLEVARNASGAAEVSDNAKEKAEEGQIIVKNTMQAIKEVENQAQVLKDNMEQLGQQAEEIGTVMNVIADIADQTNLLALNAAIEAARAGEYGRGFAVVADEVRKLAEKTMTATKEVGDAIEHIQEGTRGAVKNMENSVASVEEATKLSESSEQALEEIVNLIETASDRVRSIATASEEQSASSEEINMAIGEINRISTETAEAMEQSAQAVSELAQLAQGLNRLISDLQNA